MSLQPTTRLDFTGLATRPAQTWGAVRLVPLVRAEPITDLRLSEQVYQAQGDRRPSQVRLGRRGTYTSYIPHGLVADWGRDGTAAATFGTRLGAAEPRAVRLDLRTHHRLARRIDRTRLRFLPLHLALEGYLALHFRGPEIAWREWSDRAVRQGLSPRAEEALLGAEVAGLADALRIFEIHPGQCGVLLYVADALAAAFVVPHPADYRALHPTLVQDLFGELVHHYATLMPPVPAFRAALPDAGIRTLADLRAAAERQDRDWAAFHETVLAAGLLGPEYHAQRVYRLGRFALHRLLPVFRPKEENHLAETITDEQGRIAYLKTFRLSEKQVRRGHLLSRLAAHDWNLAATAGALGITEAALGVRLAGAGFELLLRQDVLDGFRRRVRAGES
ncbi:ARPP-2 domain-containing protein [Kitasatospora sp. LaBMicrA B282]|uniref:ARPP-2 domain-containing protein n=1 Tax=Kitasatospora sp. LaBMicrA B282 TaxID=3420949 RepID=UPI003D0C105D